MIKILILAFLCSLISCSDDGGSKKKKNTTYEDWRNRYQFPNEDDVLGPRGRENIIYPMTAEQDLTEPGGCLNLALLGLQKSMWSMFSPNRKGFVTFNWPENVYFDFEQRRRIDLKTFSFLNALEHHWFDRDGGILYRDAANGKYVDYDLVTGKTREVDAVEVQQRIGGKEDQGILVNNGEDRYRYGWLVSVATGERRKIPGMSVLDNFDPWNHKIFLKPDHSGIYLAVEEKYENGPSSPQIFEVPFDGGPAKHIITLPGTNKVSGGYALELDGPKLFVFESNYEWLLVDPIKGSLEYKLGYQGNGFLLEDNKRMFFDKTPPFVLDIATGAKQVFEVPGEGLRLTKYLPKTKKLIWANDKRNLVNTFEGERVCEFSGRYDYSSDAEYAEDEVVMFGDDKQFHFVKFATEL